MALQSIAILDTGKENITKLLTGFGESYNGIGVGNDSTPVNQSTHEHLLGDETCFKDGNASYLQLANNSYAAQWSNVFQHDDLPSNTLTEAAVSVNASNQTTACLLRCTFDPVVLGEGEQFSVVLQVIPMQP